MPRYIYIDIETFSRIELRRTGVYPYSEHKDFRVLMMSWTEDGVNYDTALGHEDIEDLLLKWLADPDVVFVAHNAQFERICLSRIIYPDQPTRFLPAERFLCTAVIASELGWPRHLEGLARALGVAQKDSAGTRLINIFSKPISAGKRKGERCMPEERPDDWLSFILYCEQDVRAMYEAFQKMGGKWPNEKERDIWYADQYINDEGVAIDIPMTAAAVAADLHNRAVTVGKMKEITGLDNPNSNDQLTGWLLTKKIKVPNLQKETVANILDDGNLDRDVRRVLQMRRGLALTTPKKFGTSMESLCVDGRLRGQFKFFGAHTGRWSGQNVQLQNLTRSALKPDQDFQDRLALRTTLTKDQKEKLEARETLRLVEAAILDLKMGFGADQNTLKSLVRAMFIGPFVVCDYSAIEARVLAWLAGEQWVLDAFLSGKDIYVETAERMSTETKKMTRFDGKVATLALGYQGAVGALARMGAVGTEQELVTLVKQWRKTNPNIVKFWYDLERVFKRGGKAGRITVETDGPHRHVILPSGRRIIYHNVKMVGDRLTFADPAGYRTEVYGGKLSENVTQAVARDILAEALVRCHEAGVKVVMHIHDEIVAEGCTKDELEKLMVHQPVWADGLPLDAEGEGPMERYQKL